MESKTELSSAGRYLCFSLGNEKFAMTLLQVKEVIANVPTTSIPQAPAYFKGLMNLRGLVIPVIDLRSKLKIGKGEFNSETTIVILDLDGLFSGVVVDSVDSVVIFDQSMISETPVRDAATKVDYIVGVAKQEKSLTLIMDMKKVLNTEDLKAMRLQSQKAA